MGGGVLNLVAVGNLNIILNGNPKKTFFKTTYTKYKNFGLQRFLIPYKEKTSLSLFSNSLFRFKIPTNGDILLDTHFSIDLPDIYSPLYTIPSIYDGNKLINSDLSGLSYCQPYEFRWIENIGTQLIKKVRYLIDGRVIQEYTGHYINCKAKRDLTSEKYELFNEMIGNITELTNPENFSNNNGNYPSASWGKLSRVYWPNGIEPSIRGRKLFIPLFIWETFNSYKSFPIIALYYSKLEVEIECRPIQELFRVRDINYFEKFVKEELCNSTQIKKDITNMFKYYNPPLIAPNLNDIRYHWSFFLQEPPENSRCIGDEIGDVSFNYKSVKTTEDALKNILDNYYTNNGTWNENITLYSTYAFLEEEEKRLIAGIPQEYLIKTVHEKTINFVQGTHSENVDATGLTVSWMWFFQRSDIVLRNEWSNYSNWPYNNKMPFPCILGIDLSFVLQNELLVNTPYIDPPLKVCTNDIDNLYNPCLMYYSGPTHPMNQQNIMIDWGIYCNKIEREKIFPAEINTTIDIYLNIEGNGGDGIYFYNFNIDKNNSQPSGSMNLSKFTDVVFEFTTYDPYIESISVFNPSEYILTNPINAGTINEYFHTSPLDININCTNNNLGWYLGGVNQYSCEYFNKSTPGGPIHSVNTNFLSDSINYNYSLHIIEERYNIIQFSGGMARYLF